MTEWKQVIRGTAKLQEQYECDGAITFEQMRDGVVAVLRRELASLVDIDSDACDWMLVDILNELEEVSDGGGYDAVKNDLYDWCDAHRVWLDPIT